MIFLLRCSVCKKSTSHKPQGKLILAPLPMMAENDKMRPGSYKCLTCGNVVVVDEHGVVEDLESAALQDKVDMFGPDSLSEDERILLEEVKDVK